jgi:hypothetical protein
MMKAPMREDGIIGYFNYFALGHKDMTDNPKHLLNNARSAITGILACIAFITACTENPSSGAEAASTPPATLAASNDLSFFDRIVTPEAVFPDPAERALFEAHPPETSENGWRGYAFSLIQQPGMNPNEDFCIVSVTWAPAGTFRQGSSGLAGPGGGFADFVVRTPDDVYDLRISLGTLLPVEVDMPEFDPGATAERLLLRYSHHLKNDQIIER